MKRIFKHIFLVLPLMALLFIGSCSDESNPVNPDSEHFKANGLILESMGQRIFTFFKLKTNDTIFAPIGLTDHYEMQFLDADSNVIVPPTDKEHKLGWVIGDTSMLEIYRHDGEEWELHFKGKKVGYTNIEFQVLHNDHPDFKTIKIPVVIKDMENQHGAPVGVRAYFEEDETLIADSPTNDLTKLVSGEFTLKIDETTDHIVVKFYDEQNREFQPPADHKLIIEFENSGVCEAIPAGEDEPWAFQLKSLAKNSATTKIIFKIAGEDGSIHKTFKPITVSIK